VRVSHSGVSLKKAKTTFGVAELGYEIIGAIPPWLPLPPRARGQGGVGTEALPLQVNHTFIQQRPTFY
jgi:hypothetical protein